MLTTDDMKWFIDPLADVFAPGDKIYVTTERIIRGIHLGKIVEVAGLSKHGSRQWRVTAGTKDHVYGPVANSHMIGYNTPVIGWLEAEGKDGWMVGSYVGDRGNRALIESPKYADQRQMPLMPSGVNPGGVDQVDVWFTAAPWARELMAEPDDCEDAVQAKLALAKQRWEQRHAKVIVTEESMQRGYSQLDILVEEGHLPMPVFGGFFNGTVMVPAGRAPGRDDRTVSVQERIDAISKVTGNAVEPSQMMMALSLVNTPLNLRAEGRDGVTKVSPNTVRDAVQTRLNNYDLHVGSYNLSPALRDFAA